MKTTLGSLTDLAERLEKQVGNPAGFMAVSTRVLLRTGVNLRAPKPEQNTDGEVLARIQAVLAEMGYRV